jgi:hypothetical protein
MTDRHSNDQEYEKIQGAASADREELLHLAELEARGLIEAAESQRLERLFAAAAPSVQAEVMALQEKLVLEPSLRSDKLPAESLRLRTLGRIAQAVEQESAAAAPIATIGPRAGAARASDARRDQMSVDAVRSIIDGITRERERLQTVRQPVWRVAAFLLFAALAVSAYHNWEYISLSRKLAGYANADFVDKDMREIAVAMAGFDFGRARHLDLKRIQGAPSAHVEIFTDPDTGRVAVLGVGFDDGETLEIVIRDPEGGLPHIQQVRVSGMGFGRLCEVPADFARAGLVEIRSGSGATLFTA